MHRESYTVEDMFSEISLFVSIWYHLLFTYTYFFSSDTKNIFKKIIARRPTERGISLKYFFKLFSMF